MPKNFALADLFAPIALISRFVLNYSSCIRSFNGKTARAEG
jgi:hypothetical protein